MRNALSKVGDTASRIGRNRVTAALLGGALVLMLGGGTAVAAGHISGDDIQHYSITKQHLKKDSVGSWEVLDRSLGGWDLRQDSVGRNVWTPYLRSMIEQWEAGEFSEPGPQGPAGEDGTDGKDGADGVSGYEVIANEQRLPAGTHTVVAECPADKVAVGGGYELSADGANGANTTVQQSQTTGLTEQADGTWQGTSHTVRATIDAATGNVKAVVNCASTN